MSNLPNLPSNGPQGPFKPPQQGGNQIFLNNTQANQPQGQDQPSFKPPFVGNPTINFPPQPGFIPPTRPPGNHGMFPLPNTDIIAKKDEQIKKLKSELKSLEDEQEEKDNQISKLKADLSSANTKLKNAIEDSETKDQQIRQLEEDLESQKDKNKRDISRLEQSIRQKIGNLESQHKQDIEEKENQIKKLQQQLLNSQSGNQDALYLDMKNQIQFLQEKLNHEQKKNKELQSQIGNSIEDDQINSKMADLQDQLFQAQQEIVKEHNNFTNELEKNRENVQKIRGLEIQIIQRDQSLDTAQQVLKTTKKDLNDVKIQLQEKEEDYKQLQIQIQSLKQENDGLIQQIFKSKDKESEKLIEEMKQQRQFLEDEQKRMIEEREFAKAQKRQEQEQRLQQKAQQEKQQRDYNLQKTAAERQKLGQLMKNKAISSMGEMEVCFVVDITSSMDPYKQQTEECIQGSVDAIKKETGRNARWSTVAYQDIDEWKRNKNSYLQHDFTEDSKKIIDYLRQTKCAGGDDYCEDVKGGLDQMMKLSWKTKFRVAVLICDAPAHGANVNMGCGDKLPKDDISEVIKKMIEQEIVFIVIQFCQWTKQMIEHFKNLYVAGGKPELFITIDLQTIKVEDVWKSLIDIIKDASAVATGVKNSASKVKGNQKARPKTKDGAMEALCKEKNFKNFDQKADICVESDFQVFRVDLKEQAFEDNILSIQNINNEDFQTNEEGKWSCIRTKEPFAFGMMKSVYLMKKKNNEQNHLYVIKMPLEGFYESLDQAKGECRSHLICKNLMRKFMKTLREKHDQKNKPHKQYPEIYYSDFLILQENPRKFWIAERFFDGEFIKYNNNWGFIDDKLTPMNQLAQAFTQYTYYISNYQYMINDVQGVGVYFTDPAVNTQSGDYDDTDMGVDGQSMYMVSFEHKKHISKEILEVMDILIE